MSTDNDPYDPPWEDERIKGFLSISPYDTRMNADYNVLLKAYHAMRIGEFQRFLVFFSEAKRDINARNEKGETLLDRVSEHRRCAEYAEALREHGAKLSSEMDLVRQ